MSESRPRPKLAVFKFASCDGCQLQVLNLEHRLLELADRFEIAHFPEATSRVVEGPYDVSLVEGSIATSQDVERIHRVRDQSGTLVSIGACATAGGIQHLRDGADVEEWKRQIYPHPEWIDALETSTAISQHVTVDHELPGCPIDAGQLLRVLTCLLLGATPDLPGASVCIECKRAGHACVVVTRGLPCMGPVTRAGCGALCPSVGRDCYACFGPQDDPRSESWADALTKLGLSARDVELRFRGITGQADAFRRVADALAVHDE